MANNLPFKNMGNDKNKNEHWNLGPQTVKDKKKNKQEQKFVIQLPFANIFLQIYGTIEYKLQNKLL